MEEDSLSKMEPLYHSFLESLLSLIQILNRQVDTAKTPQNAKYWGVMLGQTCEILDKVCGNFLLIVPTIFFRAEC